MVGTTTTIAPVDLQIQARGEIEAALDGADWPWSRRLSFWIDALIIVEEG